LEIRKLNTLRGLAAIIVFFTHFSDETQWLDGVLGGAAGQYGVMLFFLLSGFLMSHLYLHRDYSQANVRDYLLARAGRILPLYLLVVLASWWMTKSGSDALYNIPDTGSLAAHLLFIYGESVLWSISPEVIFYLLFILIWPLARHRAGYIYVIVFTVLVALFFSNFPRWVGEFHGMPYNLFRVLRSLPYFFVGMLLGMHYRTLTVPAYMRKNRFLLALLLIPLLYPSFSPVTSDAIKRMWLSYEVLLVMSGVFAAVVFLVPDNNRLLANKLGDFLGKISFSLYLFHLPIIRMVQQWSLNTELKLFLSLALTIIAAWLSYRYFEGPAAKLIRGTVAYRAPMDSPLINK